MNVDPVHFALLEIGIEEIPGTYANPRIVAYHSVTTGKFESDEVPWCSSFVNYCFWLSGDESKTGSAASQSWLGWGFTTRFPRLGDLAIFTNKANNTRGHVGFYIDQSDTHVLVLGGNQGNAVSFQWYPKKGKYLNFNCYKTWR